VRSFPGGDPVRGDAPRGDPLYVEGTGPSCPGEEDLRERFDEPALRAHVAECERCLERHGALFELELLAPALPRDAIVRPRPSAWRSAERIGVAAALLAAVLLAARARFRDAEAAPRPSAFRLVELMFSESTTTRAGTVETRRTFDSSDPALCRIEEIRTSADGSATVHSRVRPVAALQEE
jgi:hypothetical protein